jgi:hypothetical protein
MTATLILAITSVPASGHAGIWDYVQVNSDPPTLPQVARMIDSIQNEILNQGTVVVKQPDIWSQARMTKFRKEFEDTMRPEVSNFKDYLSGQIARSDSAAFSSQTNLAATLLPTGSAPSISQGPLGPVPASAPATDFTLLNAAAASSAGAKAPASALSLSVEPNVHIDEEQDYIGHLHRIRRVNLGDDTADSAGYGLYLMRVPVSVQPGDATVKGYGAIVNVSVRHEFSPMFLLDTYRNLVINDISDLLAPMVHELIRSGQAANYAIAVQNHLKAREQAETAQKSAPQMNEMDQGRLSDLRKQEAEAQTRVRNLELLQKLAVTVRPSNRSGTRNFAIAPSDVSRIFGPQNLLNLAFAAQSALDLGSSVFPKTTRINLVDVRSYLRQELDAAFDLMSGRCHDSPPPLMDVDYIEKLTDQVYCRKYEGPKGVPVDSAGELSDFYRLYEGFTHRLPGNLRFRPIGVLSWAIAVEAGLLNRQLREDMKNTTFPDGCACPPNVDNLFFYAPFPTPETVAAFESYVRAKWPMVAFAIEPVIDQQNIEDSFTRRRDLQLAIAFALSSGQISFQQAMQYTRTLQYQAQTIALNQTVAAFAHGNDTFGWRITPRFQTPPEESNLRALTNLLLRGGPGPNYGLKNAKIEPGLREMTAVVIMPSFVRGLRLDIANNWFRLYDPDDFKIHTARAVELGRRINEARLALNSAHICRVYRAEDIQRLRARLHQLEQMLPLQSASVRVPYQNTLGGFALFTQGASDLAPELDGHEGVEYIDPNAYTDLMLYGRHFSLYETAVVVGGVQLPRVGLEQVAAFNASTGKSSIVSATLTGLKDPSGNLLMLNADGTTTTPVKDLGNYDILSREVLKVHIPPNVQTATREDGTSVVEIYVSTPNGISNKVQIPLRPGGMATIAPVNPPGFVLVDDTLSVPLSAHATGSGSATAYDLPPTAFAADAHLRLQPINPPSPPPPMVDVTMTFDTSIGTVSRTITNVVWDGNFYTITPTQLTTFAADLLTLLQSNKLIPPPPPPTPNTYLKTKSITVWAIGQPAASTTVNQLNINLQANLVQGTTSSRARANSRTVVAGAPSNGARTAIGTLASRSSAVRGAAREGTGTGSSRDSSTLPAAFQEPPPELDLNPLGALPPQIEALPTQFQAFSHQTSAQLQSLNDKTTAQFKSLHDNTAALTKQLSTTVNRLSTASPVPPVINVAVPVTNAPQPKKQHRGLFHRQAGTPQNPTKPSLMQRLMNP